MSNNQEQQAAVTATAKDDRDDDEVPLPGFRFHPTDEELVGFYLRRKVDKKPLSIELIKQVDIYKYDPWELPKPSGAGDKEGYFFCKRGRKYRNSIRPNRVTGSGFWKATGIDKPVYSHEGEGRDCIGLKKTLVYYRGSAGKGTKTDWMMHEFRLPTNDNSTTTSNSMVIAKNPAAQEAEVWTLCRIFKRNVSYRKYTPDWRELSTKRTQPAAIETSSITCSVDSNSRENYLSFGAPASPSLVQQVAHDMKPVVNHAIGERKQFNIEQFSSAAVAAPHYLSSMASSSNNYNVLQSPYASEQVFTYADWDELKSVVEFAYNPSLM